MKTRKRSQLEAMLNVERPQEHQLYWPDMDVDLAVESIEYPDRFPVNANVGESPEHQ